MTFAQYQQLQSFAKKRIADKLAEIQPRSGNLVSVLGDGISIELPIPSAADEQAEDQWVFVLYYRRRYINIGQGDFDTEWSDWDVAAWAPRTSSGLLPGGFFTQDSTFFNLVPDDDDEPGAQPFGRSVEMDFQIRTSPRPYPGGGWPEFENAQYRAPLELTLEEYSELNGIFIETIKTYKIKLRRSGHQQTFNPSSPNTYYRLRPTAFTRL